MSHTSQTTAPPAGKVQMLLDSGTLSLLAHGNTGQRVEGSIAAVRTGLARSPLHEGRLELAIAQVEDLIMPMLRTMPPAATLEVLGTELVAVVDLLAQGDGGGTGAVRIEAVENLFNQLADHAAGSAVAWRHPVPAASVALGLLVLREVMHHGGFEAVTYADDQGQG
jgi:hypothetical protein